MPVYLKLALDQKNTHLLLCIVVIFSRINALTCYLTLAVLASVLYIPLFAIDSE